MNTSIKNGMPMYDVCGNRMHVQFPHIIYHNDKYYLYGTNKEFSDGKSGICIGVFACMSRRICTIGRT